MFLFSSNSKLFSSIHLALASHYPPGILLVTLLHHKPLYYSTFGSSWSWRWKKLLSTTSVKQKLKVWIRAIQWNWLGFHVTMQECFYMLLELPFPPPPDTWKQWLLYIHQAFTQALNLQKHPGGLLHYHRAVHTIVACSLLFRKLFSLHNLFCFLYFTSDDNITLKICLKFMVVWRGLIKACQYDGIFHSGDMQEDNDLALKMWIQCPKHRLWINNKKQKRIMKRLF